MYYTSNQPIDSNIPLAIISNWLERMCNNIIIPLQQKPILDTHSHVHTCLLLRPIYTEVSNQPIDSNIPLAIINNWLKRMCNIIPLYTTEVLVVKLK